MRRPSSLVRRTIKHAIHNLRGHRVMPDADLAVLHGVTTG